MSIHTICICGAGTMGSGIAQVCTLAGKKVVQFDVNPAMLEKSREGIQKSLDLLVSKNKISEQAAASALANLYFTSDIADCVGDLVIEAIVEKKEAKTSLFRQVLPFNKKETIFATNTSSISIDEITESFPAPQQVIGMHFFNPAPLMKLVEVIKGEQTADAVVDIILQLTRDLGKTPVLCKDAPGFIVNRVARPYYLEAMRLVEEGLATMETVDAIMESTGFKMGPFKLMDLIGIDINYSVSSIVWESLGQPERLTPSPLQKQKIDQNLLGRKTAKGFYSY